MKTEQSIPIIQKAYERLEILTGLHQWEKVNEETQQLLLIEMAKVCKRFGWLTPETLTAILDRGMIGAYGDITGLHPVSLNTWLMNMKKTTYGDSQNLKTAEQIKEEKEHSEKMRLWVEAKRKKDGPDWYKQELEIEKKRAKANPSKAKGMGERLKEQIYGLKPK